MRDLTAQVTSSLLQFPEVTVEALGEDEITLDSVLCGKFSGDLEVVIRIPAEVPQRREAVTREGRHLCFQLRSPSGTAVSTLCYISRSNQLVVGFSNGYLSLWNMKTLKREHHSQLEGGRIPIYAVTFQEPENDPRNCCYLWAVQSTQQSEGDVVSLHLLQLAFGDRKRLASGQVMYEGLEYCDERYSLDLTGGIFPLRGQTSNTKLLSCQTIEKFRNHVDREDSVNEELILFEQDKETTLKFLKKSGPLISEAIHDSYTRCLVAGLLSPRLVDVQPSSLTQTIYLLLDIMHSFPDKTETSIDSFPTAFAIPWGLVKLIQGFWLLDHNDYENDRDPRLRERAVVRNSLLDQYGKILPRVQRKLAVERAKPYRLPSSVLKEVSRPKPLSTVTRQANAGNVHTRATFISKVLSKIGEVWLGNDQKPNISQYDSPRATEPAVITHPLPGLELPDAFLGTPVTKFSQKCSSPLKSNTHHSISQKNFPRASELNLLETPLVVKRAKVLATSSSGFPGFTPQSILRSSLRTTPLATPSASPGRSVTPPLRAKEPRISFMEENSNAKWTVGVTEDDKALFGASSEHHDDMVEDAWSESRGKTTLFTLNNPEEDNHAELQESSENISGGDLLKMDVSKENSDFSVRSDQTTLEYHDAKSPGDFEDDVIFIAAKPANSSTEETADVQELEKEEDSEMTEDKPFQMEQPDPSEPRKEAGSVEESNAECLTCPEDDKLVLKAAEATTFRAANEGETNSQESKMTSSSEEKAILVATNPQLSESLEADSESVIGVLDSEDVVSTHSENHLEGKNMDLPEECNPEAAEIEKVAVSNNFPKTEEINVIEDTSEPPPETSPYCELDPSGNLNYSYENIEQQFACDLPDNKDSECDAAEGDGDLFLSQSSFSLVLEGEEGEAEVGDPTLVDASKPDGTTIEEKPVTNSGNTESQEHVTNSVSTVTGDQESQNTESLPYVPEPIKVAIAENLLDVIKDTRSKEFTSEVVEQSIHETLGKKVTRFQKAKALLPPVPEGVEEESSRPQLEYAIAPRTRTRGQLSRISILSADPQQLLKTDTPVAFGLSPRRSTRRTKEASETSSLQTEEKAQEEQIPVMPVTPRRGRKPKLTHLEKTESSHSDGQTLSDTTQSIAVTPRRRLRRTKEASSELLEEANEEISLPEGSIIASSRRTRGGKSSAGDQEGGQTDTDHNIKAGVSPSRSARKPKSFNLQFTEKTVKDQEVQPSDQLVSPVPAKRGRRRKRSSSEVSEHSDLDLSKSSLPQTEFKLPATPRRSARKVAQNLLTHPEFTSTQEDINSGGKVEVFSSTPKKRTRREPQETPKITDTGAQTPAQPSEEPTTPRTAVRTGRRGRKKRSLSAEAFPQGPGGSPLLLEDINPSRRDRTSKALTDRVTRTRSRKTAMHQKLTVEENEAFHFSPPLTKLTKKFEDGKADHPMQFKDLDPDLSSQFVFSPPLLRSRNKTVSSISRIVKEPVNYSLAVLVQEQAYPTAVSDVLCIAAELGLKHELLDKNGMLISAGSNSYTGQSGILCGLGQGVLGNTWPGYYNAALLVQSDQPRAELFDDRLWCKQGPGTCCVQRALQEKKKQYHVGLAQSVSYF
ncbi:protein ELYS-like protein [Willisornis vidua]|uniref:Protein ELYS-like protein n=1 Tax=Willisornis vidua TaxID=1566151 RepID=A0ABQ9DCF1_9PASS|nr:protein ELYS-like protein [Willisornis vidua]